MRWKASTCVTARAGRSSLRRLALLLLLLAACGRPDSGSPQGTLATVEADTLAAWIEAGAPVLCYDMRPREAYERAHLPGAVPVEDHPLARFREILPADINVALVFYNQDGSGPPEGSSVREAAEKHRFRRLYWLRGGMDAWLAGSHGTDGSVPVGTP